MIEALYALALLACPLGMGAMMWFMMRRDKGTGQAAPSQPSATPPATEAELVALRAELDQLQAEERERKSQAGPRPQGSVR